MPSNSDYKFSNNWFVHSAKAIWDQIIPQLNPRKILEIGSYEGASTCYLIEKLGHQQDIELHCIDTWAGGIEHQGTDMAAVEQNFWANINLALAKVSHRVDLVVHKGFSDLKLAELLTQGKRNYFDFIYVDGSHQAPDVLCDAILSFRLLRKFGLLAFDDYLWHEHLPYGVDPLRCPKPAIDAFTNLYCRQLRIVSAPLYQVYIQKISD